MTRAQADQMLGALTRMQASIDRLTRIVLAQSESSLEERPLRGIPNHPQDRREAIDDIFQNPTQALNEEEQLEMELQHHHTEGANSRRGDTFYDEQNEREAVEEEIRMFRERRASGGRIVARMDPEEGGP